MFLKQESFRIYISLLLFFAGTFLSSAQLYNTDVAAKINIEKNSEFFTFVATAQNKTPSDYSLRYDYMVFVKDKEGKIVKKNKEERIFLKAYEKKILDPVTINYNSEGEITIVLLIYDQDDKPIGQDRIVLPEGGKTKIEITNEPKTTINSNEVAKPQDGVLLNGLVIENTLTKAGRDFYRIFYLQLYNLNIQTAKNIKVEEVFGRGRNTRISVKVEDVLVWQFFAQPRIAFLKQMSDYAVSRVVRQLQILEQQKDRLIRY